MKESERVNILERLLFTGTTTPMEFEWEQLTPDVDIYQLLTQEDIDYMYSIITSARYSGNSKLRISKLDEIMKFRNFTKFAGGTNRLVYIHPMAPNMVFKIAVDAVGIRDNPSEYYNQKLLKPFCTKVFQCSKCGTIASFQRVEKITSEEEFFSVIDDYLLLLEVLVDGKHVFDDIGAKYFMNYGIWKGKGLVILDFPYMYEIDGSKLICKSKLDDGTICNGEIDYTKTFDEIRCTKCGRIYRAGDLAKTPEGGASITRRKGEARMKFSLKRGDKIIKTIETGSEVDYLTRKEHNKPKYTKIEEKYKVRPAKLIKVKDVSIIKHTENPFNVEGNTLIINTKKTNTPNTQSNTDGKEVVKYVEVNLKNKISVNNDKDKSSIIDPKLIKVKKKTKSNNFNQYKNKKVKNVGNYINNKKPTIDKDKPDIVVNKIVGSTNINISAENGIITKKDNTIDPGIIKVTRKISIPESEVKRFSAKPTTSAKEEITTVVDPITNENDKVSTTEEMIISNEEEQNSIDSLIEEEAKELTDAYNAAVEVIKSTSEDITKVEAVIDSINEEKESKEKEDEEDDKEYYEVKFVKEISSESFEPDYDEYTIYAHYIGNDDNFKEHTEYIEDLRSIDKSDYILYGSYKGQLYSIDLDEKGSISFLYDEEDDGEYEHYENNEISEKAFIDDELKEKPEEDKSIPSDDEDSIIINNLKKSGSKPSVIDVL